MGYLSADGLVIHRTTCPNLQKLLSLDSSKIRPLRWNPTPTKQFLVALHLEGEDRPGMLLDIVKVISIRKRKNIRSIRIEGHGTYFQGVVELWIYTEHDLISLIQELEKVRGLLKIERYLSPAIV
jgi:GTP pyrophosphokinase